CLFFFSSRRRHTRSLRDWSSDVCSSDLSSSDSRAIERPQIPFVAVGGTLAAAILCGLSIARESDDEARADIAQQAERVPQFDDRSEERRVGKECRSRWGRGHYVKKKEM